MSIKDAVSNMVNRPVKVDKSRHLNPMVFVAILGFVLLMVTGFHSAHLLTMTVASDMVVIAVAGLAAFDIGFLMWPFAVKSPHSNPSQKSIALLMTTLCGSFVALAFISDVAMTMNLGIAEAPWFKGAIVVLVATAILSNVIAFISYHLCSSGESSESVSYGSAPSVPDIDYDKLAQYVASQIRDTYAKPKEMASMAAEGSVFNLTDKERMAHSNTPDPKG